MKARMRDYTNFLIVALLSFGLPTGVTSQWNHYCEIELSFKIMCYYVNWAQYRPGFASYTVDDIDPCLCTHILYAFARVERNQLFTIEQNDEEMFQKLYDLKPINADLKNIISIGGDEMGVKEFEYIVGTEYNRTQFANNALSFIKKHRFDGIDVDWEFPDTAHKTNFTLLMKELHDVFEYDYMKYGGKRKEIICALAAQSAIMEGSYDYPEIAKYIDYGNVMTYDLHGGWDDETGFHSALRGSPVYTNDQFCQDWVVNKTLELGFPADKLVLGIPAYGRSFRLCNYTQHDVRSPSCGHGEPAPQTTVNGTMAYYEICRRIGFETVYDEYQRVPYDYDFDLWVSYDNVKSIQEKKEFAYSLGLAGVMYWDLSMDDFSDQCGGGKYPLLKVFDPNLAPRASCTAWLLALCVLSAMLHYLYN